MVIIVLDHVPQCYTGEDGAVIASIIRRHLDKGLAVSVSMAGVEDTPSSFVNAAFVSLLDHYDAAYIRAHLSITDASRQTGDMVRRCFQNAERQRQAA
jgi:hypothetical protein